MIYRTGGILVKKFTTAVIAALCISVQSVAASAAEPIIIKPDISSNEGKIDRMMYGIGMEYDVGYLNQHLQEPGWAQMFKEDGLSHIRFPNGTGALWYAWHDPTKSVGSPQNALHTDTVAKCCEDADMELVIQVNTYQYWDFDRQTLVKVEKYNQELGAKYAADWVEYCNAPNDGSNPNGGIDWAAERARRGRNEPWNVHYWEIGNEDWTEYYGGDLRELSDAYAKAMKQVDQTIEVIYQGSSGDGGYFNEKVMHPTREFNEGMFKPTENGENADYASMHIYLGQRRLGGATFMQGNKDMVTHKGEWKSIDYTKNAKMLQSAMVNSPCYALYHDAEYLHDLTAEITVQNRDFNPSSRGSGGLIFGYKDDKNYNMAYIIVEDGKTYLKIIARENGIDNVYAAQKISDSAELSDDYNIKIDIKDGKLRANAWLVGTSRQSWLIDMDNTLPNRFGSIGFGTMPDSVMSFDEINLYDNGNVIYEEFDENALERFDASSGGWSVSEGKLVQNGAVNSSRIAYWNAVDSYRSFDGRVKINAPGGQSGLAFAINGDSYYSAEIAQNGLLSIYRSVNGSKELIGSKAVNISQNDELWLSVNVEALGTFSNISAKAWRGYHGAHEPAEYELICTVPENLSGKIGVVTDSQGASFEHLSAARVTKKTDSFDKDKGYWSCTGGIGEIRNGRYFMQSNPKQMAIAELTDSENKNAFILTAKVFDRSYTTESTEKVGVAFAISEDKKSYYCVYFQGDNTLVVSKVTDGLTEDILGTSKLSSPISRDAPCYIKIDANQKLVDIKVWGEGQGEPASPFRTMLTYVDESYMQSGSVGLFTVGAASFDDVVFTDGYEQALSDVKACGGEATTQVGLDYINRTFKEMNTKAKIYMSEYNHMEPDEEALYYYYLQNYPHAVLISDWVGALIEARCAMASYHCVSGPSMFTAYDPYDGVGKEKKGVQLLALSLYSKYFGDRLIKHESVNMPKYPYSKMYLYGGVETKNLDIVSTHTSINESKNSLEVMLVSRDNENARDIVIDLGSAVGTGKAEVHMLGNNNAITDGNIVDRTTVSIEDSVIDYSGSTVKLTLPAHTIAEISIPLRK